MFVFLFLFLLLQAILEASAEGRFDLTKKGWPEVSDQAKEVVRGLLEVNPDRRMTARQALDHPWFNAGTSGAEGNGGAAEEAGALKASQDRLQQLNVMRASKKVR